jgi:WD40 repeat protein
MKSKALLFLLLLWPGFVIGQQPKLMLPIGHTGAILAASFSNDGKKVATASHDNTVKIWDAQTGVMLADLRGHKMDIHCVNFSPDGSKVVSAGWDNTAKVWDVNTGVLLINFTKHTSHINTAFFSPDGKRIVTASDDKTAKIWDAETGAVLFDLKSDSDQAYGLIYSAVYSPDGKKIVTASLDHTAKIWDAETGALLANLKGHKSLVYKASFSYDGKKIVTACWDHTAKVWDAQTGKLLEDLIGHKKEVYSAAFSPDGNKIVTASTDKTARIWDANTGTLLTKLDGHTKEVNMAFFSPDGTKIVAASWDRAQIWNANTGALLANLDGQLIASFSPDGQTVLSVSYNSNVIISDVQTGTMLANLKGHTEEVTSASFSQDGKKIVTTSRDSMATIWDMNTGRILAKLTGHNDEVISASFSPDGTHIATVSDDDSIKVWNANSGTLIGGMYGRKIASFSPNGRKIVTKADNYKVVIWDGETGTLGVTLKGHTDYISKAFFSPDGSKIITASYDNTAKIWDAGTGAILFNLKGHTDWVYSAAISLAGDRVATASRDQTAKVWDANTGMVTSNLLGHKKAILSLAFSPDGKKIVTGSEDNTAKIWDAQTGALVADLKEHTDYVVSVGFSPDGKKVVTSSYDNTAKLWDANTGTMLADLTGHYRKVTSALFSPDGKKIVTTSEDHTSKIWDSQSGVLLYTFLSLDSIGYLAIIPSGYYMCTPNAARLLHYSTKDHKIISFEQLDVKYNRPDKVLETIGSTDTALIQSYRKAYYKRIKKLGVDTSSFGTGYSVPETDFPGRNMIKYDQPDELFKLRITGSDSTFLLDRLNVYVNGSPLFGLRGINVRPQQKHLLDTTVYIALSQGKNSIGTSVTNVNGIGSYRSVMFVNYKPSAVAKPNVYFIGIGANHFADSKYNLKYCAKDIRDLSVKLKEKYGNDIKIDTFFDEQVVAADVIALKQKLLHTTVNDKVIIAYSGHGLLSKDYDYYLSTYKINFNTPEENGMPYDMLEGMLDSIPSRQKLLLIDACNSGEVDKEELAKMTQQETNMIAQKGLKIYRADSARLGSKNTFELMQNIFVNVGKNTGATVISAAAGTQFALEKNELQNGVFTYSILEYLQHHAHVNGLKQFVNHRVIELTNGLQTPTTRQENLDYDWEIW